MIYHRCKRFIFQTFHNPLILQKTPHFDSIRLFVLPYSSTIHEPFNRTEEISNVLQRNASKDAQKCDSMLTFLKDVGFSARPSEKIVLRRPNLDLLTPNLDSNVKPKIHVFQDLGFSSCDIAVIFAAYPGAFFRSLTNGIVPCLMKLEMVLGSIDIVSEALKHFARMLSYDLEKTMSPNIDYLKSCVIGTDEIVRFAIDPYLGVVDEFKGLDDWSCREKQRNALAVPEPPPDRDRDFLRAAFNGDLKLLERLASEIGDGQVCEMVMDSKGRNALHLAAEAGKTDVCKFLVERLKFNVESRECQGNTPLLVALLHERYPTAIYLIENGAAAIDCINHLQGHTALHLVAEAGHEEIMRLLLSKGAKVEPDLNITLRTPLEFACSHKTTAFAKLLLDNGADPNSFLKMPSSPRMSSSPLMVSIVADSYECMDLLLKAGADPNISLLGRTPLQFAVLNPDVRLIKGLLNAGADANIVDPLWLITPLEMAAIRDDVDEVKILFPFTSRISYIPDWSVDGIIKHCRSKETETQIKKRLKEYFELSKAKGLEAFEKKDYEDAVKWSFQASSADPTNAEMHSNQSLCWIKLNRPRHALDAAKFCVKLKPDWAIAHYRMGAAHMLLNDYSSALKAFSEALRLDPNNMNIKKAYMEAWEAEVGMPVSENF